MKYGKFLEKAFFMKLLDSLVENLGGIFMLQISPLLLREPGQWSAKIFKN